MQDSYEAAEVSPRTFFRWREEEAFGAAWKQAMKAGVGPLLKELKRRAFEGKDDPQSLNALKLSLQFRDRDLAENTKVEHTGANGGLLGVVIQHAPLDKPPLPEGA